MNRRDIQHIVIIVKGKIAPGLGKRAWGDERRLVCGFAAGMQPQAGPGMLFVTLQTVFNSMGAAGPIFGTIFYLLVFFAALTSSIGMLEGAVAAFLDRAKEKGKKPSRAKISWTIIAITTIGSLIVAIDAMGAMAFGLSVVAMAYAIGGISGCHINPAITLGMLLSKRIGGKDAAMYMLFQVIGAFIGSAIIWAMVAGIDPGTATYIAQAGAFATTTGANACQPGVSVGTGLLAEIVFTCVFVLVALGATDGRRGAGNLAGLAIGLALVLVHIVCIPITGTSVNPARSIAPAVFAGGEALAQLWIFIIGPMAGAAIAAGIWRVVAGRD